MDEFEDHTQQEHEAYLIDQYEVEVVEPLRKALRLIKETAINRAAIVTSAKANEKAAVEVAVVGLWMVRDIAAKALGEASG